MTVNMRQVKAIEWKNKKRILDVCPTVPDTSGIYILTRQENGFKYAYVGQAKKLLTRLAGHLKGYQHIDLSIRKHGLFGRDNLTGWDIIYICFPESMLNDKEKEFILKYSKAGYQLRNKTSGSQDCTKTNIADTERKGYIQGLHKGYNNARKFVAKLFEKNLMCAINTKKETPTKNQLKAMDKFQDFIAIQGEEENGDD